MKLPFLSQSAGWSLAEITHIIAFGTGILLIEVGDGDLHAQCITPSPIWEVAITNRMRCGRPGYVTNDTYYYREEQRLWSTNYGCPNPGSVNSKYWELLIDYTGGRSNTVCNPGLCSQESAETTSYHCSDSSGDQCVSNYWYLRDYPKSLVDYWLSRTDSQDEEYWEHEYWWGIEFKGTSTDYRQYLLSEPYTLPEFASDTMNAAKAGHWTRSEGAGAMPAKLVFPSGRQCAEAQVLRVAMKFKSETGIRYRVSWDVRLQSSMRTQTIPQMVAVTGNGTDVTTPFVSLPDPLIEEEYTATLVNLNVAIVSTTPNPFAASQLWAGGSGCSMGKCSDTGADSPGDGGDYLEGVASWLSLGPGTVEDSAGVLSLWEEAPSAALATPAALKFDVNSSVVTLTTNGSTIDVAAPSMLARIVVSNDFAYWVHCSANVGGSYQTGSPFISHLIINPNGTTNFNTLRHVRFREGSAVTNEFVCETNNATNTTWTLVSGNGLRGERLAKIIQTPETRLESYSIFNPVTQQTLYRQDRLYWSLYYGDRLLSEVIDPGGLSLLTTNTYDAVGRLLLTENPDGSWVRREYDGNGVLLRSVRPFTNQPPTAAASLCRVTEYDYDSVAPLLDNLSTHVGEARTVTDLIQDEVVSKTLYAYEGDSDVYVQTAAVPDFDWDDAGNEKSHTEKDGENRLIWADNIDGTATKVEYTDNGSGRLTTTWSGVQSGGTFTEGTRTEQQVDFFGRPIYRKTYDILSGQMVASETYSEPDLLGRPTKVTYLDGSSTWEVRQDCCQAAYTIDRDDVNTTNRFDALDRIISTTRLGITTSNVLDAANRLLAQYRRGTDSSQITLQRLGYDGAGRVIRETNALNGVASFYYVVDGLGQNIRTNVFADGGTRIETYFRDGTPASVVGTAVQPVRYEYGLWQEGSDYQPYVKEIKLYTNGTDTAEWTLTVSDGRGRSYRTYFPDATNPNFPVAGNPHRESFFNSLGQLVKEQDPDGLITLYDYNLLGERAYVVQDLDKDEIIDFAGPDRITRSTNYVDTALHSGFVNTVSETWVWPQDGTTSVCSSRTESDVAGTKVWQTVYNDATAITSTSDITLPTSGNGWTRTVTQTAPDQTKVVSVYQSGRLQSVTRLDNANPGNQITRTTYGYDAHGRQSAVADARSGQTSFTFNDADMVTSVTTPAPGNGQAQQTTTTVYDSLGRAIRTVQPDGTSVTNEYFATGQLKKTSGSRTYPVEYSYDSQGRMQTMTTWQQAATSSGAAVTTWTYDTRRGWLSRKEYADPTTGQAPAVSGTNGPSYTYTAGGRLKTRIWARPGTGGQPLTTTYVYGFEAASGDPELVQISYSNDPAGTREVTMSYDRRGQATSIGQDGPVATLDYNDAGLLESESHDNGTLDGLSVVNAYDAGTLRRETGKTFNGGTSLTTNSYTFDDAGRLDTASLPGYSASYNYVANSPLVSQITFKQNTTTRMTTSRQYDLLNRLTSIGSTTNGASPVVSGFAYAYNNANQRVQTRLEDGSYWIYRYDRLGQVTSGKRYWSDGTPVAGQQFEYGFDDIGNRTSTKAGGDQVGSGLRSASYSVNRLNEYGSRDVPGAVDVLGAATSIAPVWVNSSTNGVYRRGEYFRRQVDVSNSGNPVWQGVSAYAWDGTNYRGTESGSVFVAQTPEVFTHDADGNLLTDGRWTYTWDAENRLVQMVARTAVGPQQCIRFEYDWQGRRIRKQVWNNTGGTGTPALDQKFLYDGWNLLAELNATNNAPVRSYLWGSDLSGTLQGAGGVGGLLAVFQHEGATAGAHFCAFDGNGNIAALVKATDGNTSARYEYGPFGELIRTTGVLGKANPFRFSTKYQDDETDLLYYGFRYYSPSTGRWLSRDPIEEIGGVNVYGFAQNNPRKFVDPYGLNWIRIIRALPLPPDLIERVYAWLIARLVDKQYRKTTQIDDVKCPKGASRHLLSETDEYVEDRNEITLNLVDYDVVSFRVYKPKIHKVWKVYGCCDNCWGFDTKGWNEKKDEHFEDLASEGFDFDIISGEVAVKEHSILKKRWRECKISVAPTRSWTDWYLPGF